MGSSPQKKLVTDKLFYKIGEVSNIAEVEPHVLRYWESEFSFLKPRKNKTGQRVYSRKDVEQVLKVRDLLYKEKVVGCFFAPARFVTHISGKVFKHGTIEPSKGAFAHAVNDLIYNTTNVDLHIPERGLESEDHFRRQGPKILFFGQIAEGVQIGSKPRVVPDHLGYGDASVTPDHGHDKGCPGALGSDHDNGAFFKLDRHGGCLLWLMVTDIEMKISNIYATGSDNLNWLLILIILFLTQELSRRCLPILE